jgi:hypothetical protein
MLQYALPMRRQPRKLLRQNRWLRRPAARCSNCQRMQRACETLSSKQGQPAGLLPTILPYDTTCIIETQLVAFLLMLHCLGDRASSAGAGPCNFLSLACGPIITVSMIPEMNKPSIVSFQQFTIQPRLASNTAKEQVQVTSCLKCARGSAGLQGQGGYARLRQRAHRGAEERGSSGAGCCRGGAACCRRGRGRAERQGGQRLRQAA